MICTFFGHRDAPSKMEGTIRETIERLILEGATCFYVGNNGNFDSMAHRQLKQLREKLRICLQRNTSSTSLTMAKQYIPKASKVCRRDLQ